MERKLANKLIKKYKFLQKKIKDPYPYVLFGIECGDGWYKLLDNLSSKIKKELEKDKKLKKNFYVTQIKEKFGGLRFYISYGNDKIFKLIRKAEDDSFDICESCGEKGKLINYRGWYITLCKKCKKKYEAEHK